MKIDVHTHTKKTKSGDSENRNIDADRFNEIIRATDVKILAITNHNDFDLTQYREFSLRAGDYCQIWPGIELDILEQGRRAHLIVIANPKQVEQFSMIVDALIEGKTADNFNITLVDTITSFRDLDCVYIAHYNTKKPSLQEEDMQTLIDLVPNKNRLLKEATNSISAGIYINHGHYSIYGSDVQNWDEYHEIAKELPDLRLPVESYEQFCLLLEKDAQTITTILDKKSKDSIDIYPFGVAERIALDIYNDINIIFGSKGTGKTEILRALSKYYNEIGHSTQVYESSTRRLDDAYDLRGSSYNVGVDAFGIEECTDDFDFLRTVTEKNITSIRSYTRYFAAEETNKISQSIAIKDFQMLDQSSSERAFDEIRETLDKLQEFQASVLQDNVLQDVVGDELFGRLTNILEEVLDRIKTASEARLVDFKTIALFNNLIAVFAREIARKTGQPEKPLKTGFKDYASNRIAVERAVRKILSNIGKSIEPDVSTVGSLGEKGNLCCQTNLVIQNGNFVDGRYSPVRNVAKNPQKYVAAAINTLPRHVYQNSLFEKITELKDVDNGETITCLSDLLLFKRFFILDGNPYNPSSGESSMVLLHNELKEEKEIYIIDEPEKSLGNDYISEVIVPLLKEHARMGRKIIIATHDANIAVRTLPYNSIYRKHDIANYFTFVGNPFSNNLVCINKVNPSLDWKEISMKTLEGGRSAFGERGKIYGTATV